MQYFAFFDETIFMSEGVTFDMLEHIIMIAWFNKFGIIGLVCSNFNL